MTHRIAEQIGREMDRRGITAYALAKSTGIARSTLDRRFAKPEMFTIAELDAVAIAIDCGTALDLMAAAKTTAAHGDAA